MSVIYAKNSKEADRLQEKNQDWLFCTHEKCRECEAIGSMDTMMADPSDSFLNLEVVCPRHAEEHYVTVDELGRLMNKGK